MSHSLQSAGCQSVLRVLEPRRCNLSALDTRQQEISDLDSIRVLKPEPFSRPAQPPAVPEAPRQKSDAAEQGQKTKRTEEHPIRVGVFGRGRLGTAVVECSSETRNLTVAWALGRGYAPRSPVDVVLDASRAEAVRDHLEWALSAGSDMVIGTSGWDIPDLKSLVGDRIGVLVAPNFSLAAALLRRFTLALGRFAAAYPEADLGVSEKHHRRKPDSPSGTAKSLAAALLEGCPRYKSWGTAPVEPDVISVSSLRTGYEIGYHEVLMDAPSETITLTHSARSRNLFAQGALEALKWIRGRKGVYSFDDMAAELIDPLFRFENKNTEAVG